MVDLDNDDYFEEETLVISGISVPSIEENYVDDLPSIVDRFYTRFYMHDAEKPDEDHLVLFHSNRICLICLAPSHIALKKGIEKIDYNIGNVDRSKNVVKGKGKKGGMNLQPLSALAIVTCTDGTEYKILACINGKLIETNEQFTNNPKLAAEEGDGFIAIVLPKVEHCAKLKESLLNQEQYEKLLSEQSESTTSPKTTSEYTAMEAEI